MKRNFQILVQSVQVSYLFIIKNLVLTCLNLYGQKIMIDLLRMKIGFLFEDKQLRLPINYIEPIVKLGVRWGWSSCARGIRCLVSKIPDHNSAKHTSLLIYRSMN